MKKIIGILLLVLILPLRADTLSAPKGFAGKLWSSTLALYGTKGKTTHFLCTAEPIAKIDGGYRLLSAGHCVQTVPADVQFSIADEIGGKLIPVTMVKAYLGEGIDFSLFDLKTTKKYSLFELGDERTSAVGDPTIDPNFALGLGKQISLGRITSRALSVSEDCPADGCVGGFLVQEYAGPGASGSAVVSLKTHKVIGLLVFEFGDGDVGFAVEPISFFAKFLAGPNQPHPSAKDDDESKAAPVTPAIPAEIFAAQFGESHPFMLTVHGPNPKFTQGGYTFTADAMGMELSDAYYYDVPVFIGQGDEGYRLVSTNGGYSLPVIVQVFEERKP